ncbi:hypothetical protein BKA62DRAFT_830515 [Auriculariales sp. MPI-PUGE-AT-0066]|nr:hypothetical protein BKA62DRAFT_830515 [Auriculariales sp. MPI-PUGE-AT-0066]
MAHFSHDTPLEAVATASDLMASFHALNVNSTSDAGGVPISILPDELLCEIFSYGVAGYNDYGTGSIMEPNPGRAKAPFVRSAVCKRWREACCSHAKLWHYVLVPNQESNGNTSFYLEIVLNRSREASIDIILEHICERWDVGFEARVFPPLVAQRHRWRRFVVSVEPNSTIKLLRLLCAPTPRLRTIQLSVHLNPAFRQFKIKNVDLQNFDASFDATAFLPYAPALYCITTVNLQPLWDKWLATMQPSLGMLEVLHHAISSSTVWSLLRRHTQLDWVVLGAAHLRPTLDHPGDLTLPRLDRLWIRFELSAMFVAHPTALRMPNLRKLVLDRHPTATAELHAFFQHLTATSSLSRLELRNVYHIGPGDVLALAALDRLENVEIRHAQVCVSLFEHLAHPTKGNVMWPRLACLELKRSHLDPTMERDFPCVLEFARMRRHPGPSDEENGHVKLRWVRCQLVLPDKDSGLSEEQVEEIAMIRNEIKSGIAHEQRP